MATNLDNPMQTDGFEFIEYATLEPKALAEVFQRMGFTAVARHRHKDVTLYGQGEVTSSSTPNVTVSVSRSPARTGPRCARLHSG